MTTYICKCGRTFQKNTGAGTTGFRMPDYGPEHECYGCPFVCKIATWDPTKQATAIQNHECRASKTLRYDTQAALSRGDKCVGRVYSLDLEFLHRVRDFADTLDGIEPDRYAFSDRPSDYEDDGRFKLTIYPAQNNKGIAAKQRLFERFFNPDGSRVDIAPEQEKENVLNQIKEAKAVAQGKTEPVEVGTKYYHHCLVYFAGKREDNGKYTVFLDDAQNPGPETLTEVATVPDFDTFEEAQNALDGLALKQEFSTECPTAVEIPEMKQPENDISPDGMEELAEYQELTRSNAASADGIPESGDDEADSGNGAHEVSDSDNDTDDSANDDAEQPPQSCDWKNASGADEKEEGTEEGDKEVSGDPLSLRGSEFDAIMSAADNVLNRLVSMLHQKKQRDGEMTIKVTFEDADGMGAFIFGGAVSGKINYTVKPQKIVGDALELKFDAFGNPIVPADREHQLNFDEIQPGQREYPAPGGTATVDGKTGIVEDYKEDGEEPEDPPTSDDVTNSVAGDDLEDTEDSAPGEEEPKKLYPCTNYDCPFYAYPDLGESGCGFDCTLRDSSNKADPFDVSEAVEENGCTRPEVLQAYGEDHPVESESEENEE